MLKNYIEKLEDLKGKTIKDTKIIGSRMYVKFSDDTWTSIEPRFAPYDEGCDIAIVNKYSITIHDQHWAGVITTEEYQNLIKKEQANHVRRQKADEKRTYERLKAKFEYGCEIQMQSSRICQKGTKCCIVNHDEK